jgi:ABC-2 type transport system permease protein
VTGVRNVWALVQKEWRHYFGSPIAWVALVVWTLLFGFFFYVHFEYFLRFSMRGAQMDMEGGPKMSLNEWLIRPVLQNMAVVTLFLVPMLTMRLFAEEKRQGTMELLGTLPLTDAQIVLGKFLGALGVFKVMLLVGLLDMGLLWIYASPKPEWKPLLTGVLALLLLASSAIALGAFLSTLTKNQIVAGVLTFCLLLMLWVASWMDDPSAGLLKRFFGQLGLTTHMDELMKGVIDLKDVVFYLSVTFVGLFLTHRSLESQRWRA